MDRDWGSKPGSGGAASAQDEAVNRRERLRRLALETIDLAKDPYFMRNHLGSYECKLCLTLHNNEGNYLAHTQGKSHQTNIWARISIGGPPADPNPIRFSSLRETSLTLSPLAGILAHSVPSPPSSEKMPPKGSSAALLALHYPTSIFCPRNSPFLKLRPVSRTFGFEEGDFPVLESEALFIRKAGEEIRDQVF
ncbi:hypothetical protein MLD38_021589 [Melastoma candidum]|uniref:Uncharacterized protein n=1 Tax=Melastoma candidum TaxID=119954 RepID=A0ACB9QFZ0_9MYRT|nr:hypothetical protein MLD38_021589 [Melastoma candidum]